MPDGKLGELVDLVSTIGFGSSASEARDVLGQVYEYFLGMFASAEGKRGGQNLAIRGIDFNLGREPADSFTRDQFPDLRADFILANPPFNISDWWHASLSGDARWVYGDPPQGNANYAWLQHMLHHLKPGGRAGIVRANGSMSSSVRLAEIAEHGHVLRPGRYVGAEAVEDDDEGFEAKMQALTEKLAEQMAKGRSWMA